MLMYCWAVFRIKFWRWVGYLWKNIKKQIISKTKKQTLQSIEPKYSAAVKWRWRNKGPDKLMNK